VAFGLVTSADRNAADWMPERDPAATIEGCSLAMVSANMTALEAILDYMLKIMKPMNDVFTAWKKEPGSEEYGVVNIEGFLGTLQDNLMSQLIVSQKLSITVKKTHKQEVTESILAALKVAYENGFGGALDLGYNRGTSTGLSMDVQWQYDAETGTADWSGLSKQINDLPGALALRLGEKLRELAGMETAVTPAAPKPK